MFRKEEANAAIVDICSTMGWRRIRAVLLLDPYGMQVNWTTIEAIGRARHIDLWYLFPAGTVHRLLQREGEIPAGWKNALDRLLGDASWRTEFYKTAPEPTLFGDRTRESKVADLLAIESYVAETPPPDLPGWCWAERSAATKLQRKLHVLVVLRLRQSGAESTWTCIEDRPTLVETVNQWEEGNGGIRDRMDRSNLESSCRMHDGLARVHELLCDAYGVATRSDGASQVLWYDASERWPCGLVRTDQRRRAYAAIAPDLVATTADLRQLHE